MSPCTGRESAGMFEKKITDFEVVTVNLQKDDRKKPEFLELQLFEVIQAVQDGELILCESRAIARSVAHKFEKQGTPLSGSTLKDGYGFGRTVARG